MTEENRKTCFVIAPIDEPGTETRERSDLVLEHIIRPAVEQRGFDAVRADDMENPGIITSQVIQQVLNADLVVADLTERNPNVFYELAIRHAIRKPFIQLVREGERIPFDISVTRTIFVDHTNLASAAEARRKIDAQIQSLESDPQNLDSPISTAIDLQRLRQSEIPQERSLAELLAVMSEVRTELSNISGYLNTADDSASRRQFHFINEVLSRKLDEAVAAMQSSRRGYPPVVQRSIPTIASEIGGTHGFLIMLSLFRDNAPWLYEVGREAYRMVSEGNQEGAKQTLQELTTLVRISRRALPESVAPAIEGLVEIIESLQSENNSPFDEDSLPF